jgi:exodeoxyribonuclease-5
VDGHEPDFLLTEIHRQAQDNPILHLASLVREGKSLTPGDYGDSRVVKSRDLEPGSSLTHEQVLVGKNATRRLTNRRFRESLGKEGPWPVEGEKLICLRNNHDLGLLNGSLWKTVATTPGPEDGRLLLTIEGLGGEAELSTEAHEFHFLGHSPEAMPWWERCEADEFDYGYAITVHKSQGSQWDNVMVIDEWWQRDTRARWLYTAVTRAAKRLTLVQMT